MRRSISYHGSQSLKATDLVSIEVWGGIYSLSVEKKAGTRGVDLSSQSYTMIKSKSGNPMIWTVSFPSKRPYPKGT